VNSDFPWSGEEAGNGPNGLQNAYLEGKGGVSMGDLAVQNTVHVTEVHGHDAFPGNGIVPVSEEVIEVRAE